MVTFNLFLQIYAKFYFVEKKKKYKMKDFWSIHHSLFQTMCNAKKPRWLQNSDTTVDKN